jgi:murein peptide amidase A
MRASRAVSVAAALLAAVGLTAAPAGGATRFENRIAGHALVLPPGWQARTHAEDGATVISTYRVRHPLGLVHPRVPPRAARLWLFSYGRIEPGRHVVREGRALALGPAGRLEGFGVGHVLHFEREGHVLMAVVKLGPRASRQTRRRALEVLDSVRLTPRAHRIANVHSGVLLGRSELGRPIRARRVGNPRSPRKILVFGCIHGTECAGTKVARMALELVRPIEGDLWVVQNLNPDGLALGVRQNGRGVDLNRNFDGGWSPRGRRWDAEHSGPRPFSERESRIARDLVLRLRPQVTIWYHQPQDVVRAWGPSVPAARGFAALAGERFRALPWLAGTAPHWQNRRLPDTSSFVVELPPGELPDERARRHARAIVALADGRLPHGELK